MSKILQPAYPIGEVVNCLCGAIWEVEVGDGYTYGDARIQVQPDGSKEDVVTDIAWHIPCPVCRHEKQFVKQIDDCSGPEWDLTRQAANDQRAAQETSPSDIPDPAVPPTEPSVTEKPEDIDAQVAAITDAAAAQEPTPAGTE